MKPPPDPLRMPPTDLDAEAGVLGSLMLKADSFHEISGFLRPEDFYGDANRQLFVTITGLIAENVPVDPMLVTDRLKTAGISERVGNAAYLGKVIGSVPNHAHIVYYARIVHTKANQRRLIDTGHHLAAQGHETDDPIKLAAVTAERLYSLAESSQADHEANADTIANEALDEYEQRKLGKTKCISTGIIALDTVLAGGFAPEELVILGARSSVGKTALALNILANVAVRQRKPVLMFSVEMNRREIGSRLLASLGWLDSLRLRLGRLQPEDEETMQEQARRIRESTFWVVDRPLQTAGSIVATCRRYAKRHQLGLVIVDYLQLVGADQKAERWEREVASMSRQLKAMARMLHVPVLCLAQLNKQSDGVRPRMAHMHGCEAMSHDANIVLLLWRPDRDKDSPGDQGERTILIVDKNRNGPRADIDLHWFRGSMRFETPGTL